MSKVVAVTPIWDQDADLFLDQLTQEFDRLGWEVIWHFNHIGDRNTQRCLEYPGTVGYTRQSGPSTPFYDRDRQLGVNLAEKLGAEWVVLHDADETWEPGLKEALPGMLDNPQIYGFHWYNVWGRDEDGTPLIRIDPPFVGWRKRFHPLGHGCKLQFRGRRTATPHLIGRSFPHPNTDLRILHWGFCLPWLRESHYQMWSKRIGSNFWACTIDPNREPVLKRWDPKIPHQDFIQL